MRREVTRGIAVPILDAPHAPLLPREGAPSARRRGELLVLAGGVLVLLFSCTGAKPAATDDTSSLCAGRCGLVEGIQCGDCEYGYTCNEAHYCVEIASDIPVVVSDRDAVPDTSSDPDLLPDTDTYDPDCPPLIEAQFPYYREDGTIHFCRKCDSPTVKDPQCVQNLWKEANLKLATDHPEADCYPYPCEMSNLYPRTKEQLYTENPEMPNYVPMHECDLVLPNDWWDPDSSRGQIKHWNLSDGKVGFVMYKVSLDLREYLTKRKYFIYDTVTKKYTAQSPGDYGFSYYQGNALVYFYDCRSLNLANMYNYIGYFTGDGTYRVVFNKPIYSILYTPALNEKWAFANINFVRNGTSTMYYAKVGEWKWTALGKGVAYHPDLYGDLLGFHTDAIKGYVCNLSTQPKSLADCAEVNRGNEEVRNIQFDRTHPGVFYYSSDFNRAITKVEMKGGRETWAYEDVITDFSDATKGVAYSLVVQQVKDNIVLYLEIEDFYGIEGGGLACFYRMDTKKRYCMKKMENDKQFGEWVDFPYDFSEFEGKWFLYQQHASSPLILRDMDCYCEKESVCPFEEVR